MTVVEFFINSPLENMISCLSMKPDKVIFVGEGRKMRRFVSIYEGVARRLVINSVFEIKVAPKNNITALTEALFEIVETEEDCCFDLTGGEDLALVAMGIVFQTYNGIKNIQMQRFNINTGRIIDCDNDKETPSVYSDVALSVKEYIELFGAKITDFVRYESKRDKDLDKLWSVCRTKPVAWNKLINLLGQASTTVFDKNNKNRVVIDIKQCFKIFGNSYKFEEILSFIKTLAKENLVKDVVETRETLSFVYGSPTVKKCLTKAGDILELKVLSAAVRLTDDHGAPFFSDAASGVVIDWDGVHGFGSTFDGSVNEVDVVLVKGMIPIFISCKNGSVDEGELYKLATVADKFGGKYAKKLLVLTNFKKKGYSREYFLQRAKDMGIRVIDNFRRLSEKDFSYILKNL